MPEYLPIYRHKLIYRNHRNAPVPDQLMSFYADHAVLTTKIEHYCARSYLIQFIMSLQIVLI